MTAPAPIRRLAHTAAVTHLRETVAVLVAATAVGVGLSMLIAGWTPPAVPALWEKTA